MIECDRNFFRYFARFHAAHTCMVQARKNEDLRDCQKVGFGQRGRSGRDFFFRKKVG